MANTPNRREWGVRQAVQSGLNQSCRPDFRIYDHLMTSAPAKPQVSPQIFVLIPCAGQGSRAGTSGPKQYELLLGRSLVSHTLAAFRALGGALAGLWVVVAPDDEGFSLACPDFAGPHERLVRDGGATRAASVLNGLQAMLRPQSGAAAAASATDWVLVHDAARCLITPAQISALIAACRDDAVGGLLAQKLPDTLKTGLSGRVASTLDRSDKWLAQTPQMFRVGALITALQAAGELVTDESSAMEAMGLAPLLVSGSAQNFKVTYPEDFALAEAVLLSRSSAGARNSKS